MALVELRSVTVRRDAAAVISDVDLVVDDGSLAAVVGASGSGKTTLLRSIAGLDRVASGRILLDGVDVTGLDAADRDVAFAVQGEALYPNRTVRRNISFPLEVRRRDADEIRERVGAEARALHIAELLARRPSELSAGEAKIVQIARAVVRAPSVLLLDEPFAHLDPNRATVVRRELMLLQRGFGATTIVATNDPRDAMAMPDLLVVMEGGRITQRAPPLDVYRHPDTAAAALLTGEAELIEVRVTADDAGGVRLVHPGFDVRMWQPALRTHAGRRMQMIVRPEWWSVDDAGTIRATVDANPGATGPTSLACRIGGRRIVVDDGVRRHDLRVGSVVRLRLDHLVLLDPRDGRRVPLA